MTPQQVLIHSLATAQRLLFRYCEDLQPAEYLHRPCDQANCAAWLLGHLILTERRALANIGVTDLPALPDGFDKRFARDVEAPRAEDFGDVTHLLPMFMNHRTLLIEAVETAPVEALTKTLDKPHPMFATVWEQIGFMAHHVTMHAGQITIIRRSLGRPPIV